MLQPSCPDYSIETTVRWRDSASQRRRSAAYDGGVASRPVLRLEPLAAAHLPLVMTWVNDREVMQYFAQRQDAISEEAERAYLESLVVSKADRAFSIFEGEGTDADAYVGQCSINQIYWPARNGRVFLVVRRDKQGRGLGAAALRALVDEAFGALDLHKLWLIVRRDNKSAQAMYLRAGFEFEGVLRDEYCVAGRYFDMVRMGLVRSA
jgi:diamine N-acetyltransferase